MPAETVTLPLGCPQCGARLTVVCENWQQDGKLLDTTLTCPCCRHSHVTGLPAKVVSITSPTGRQDGR